MHLGTQQPQPERSPAPGPVERQKTPARKMRCVGRGVPVRPRASQRLLTALRGLAAPQPAARPSPPRPRPGSGWCGAAKERPSSRRHGRPVPGRPVPGRPRPTPLPRLPGSPPRRGSARSGWTPPTPASPLLPGFHPPPPPPPSGRRRPWARAPWRRRRRCRWACAVRGGRREHGGGAGREGRG